MSAAPRREPSASELADDIADVKAMVAEVNAKIDGLPFLRVDVYEARHKSLRTEVALQLAALERTIGDVGTRVERVEERHTWVARTAVAGLLLPIVVAIVVGALLAGGST